MTLDESGVPAGGAADGAPLLPSRRPPGAPPVLDAHTVASGEPVEDYSWLAALQSYPRPGPRLPLQGWFLMAEALQRRVTADRHDPAQARAVGVLTEHGLLGGDGRPTDTGLPVAQALARSDSRLRVDAWTAGRSHSMHIFGSGFAAVALTTDAPHELQTADEESDLLALDVFELAWIPAAIAAWTGTAPAWSFAISPQVIDYDLLTRRLNEHDVPVPPDADDHLADMWRHPWFLWRLNTPDAAGELYVLRAGPRGGFRVEAGPEQGMVRLDPMPSRVIWRALLRVVEAAVTGR
jgi:hypothetical protein